MDEKKAQLVEIVGQMVKPRNVDEVQEIVLWANQTQTPLVPVSSGGPHFRGDTLPTAPESVIVDLSGMKRIPKIDRRNRLALIEPGTSTFLSDQLPKNPGAVHRALLAHTSGDSEGY